MRDIRKLSYYRPLRKKLLPTSHTMSSAHAVTPGMAFQMIPAGGDLTMPAPRRYARKTPPHARSAPHTFRALSGGFPITGRAASAAVLCLPLPREDGKTDDISPACP